MLTWVIFSSDKSCHCQTDVWHFYNWSEYGRFIVRNKDQATYGLGAKNMTTITDKSQLPMGYKCFDVSMTYNNPVISRLLAEKPQYLSKSAAYCLCWNTILSSIVTLDSFWQMKSTSYTVCLNNWNGWRWYITLRSWHPI